MYAPDGGQPRPRLQSRRGSMSASDPWAVHQQPYLQDGEPRGETSRLTIVRVPRTPASPDEGNSPLHSRSNSSSSIARRSSWGHHSSGSLGGGPGPARLSFAVSSFTPIGSTSTSSSPSSPTVAFGRRTYSNPNMAPFRPNLAPQQLYDLAMSSIAASASSRPSSPAPAPFTPLPKSHYLPFVVRPVEVHQLISNPPTSRLFALLGQLFPPPRDPPSDTPSEWNFSQLEHWLTKVDRHEASDRVWARNARACIRARSEPLWERFKGALGVPPELEDEEDSDNEYALEIETEKPSSTIPDTSTPAAPSTTTTASASDYPGGVPPVAVQNPEGQETDADEDEDEDDEHTLAWVEPIYPGSTPAISPAMSHITSPATDEAFGFGGRARAMENIGEEEEEAASRSATSGMPDLTPDNSETTQDDQNIQGLRIVTSTMTSPYSGPSPLIADHPLDRESGNPLFPSNFASLALSSTTASSPYAPPLHPSAYAPVRRGSRGQQSRTSRDYAETFMTGSSG